MFKFLKGKHQLRDLSIYRKILLTLILKDKKRDVEWNYPDQEGT